MLHENTRCTSKSSSSLNDENSFPICPNLAGKKKTQNHTLLFCGLLPATFAQLDSHDTPSISWKKSASFACFLKYPLFWNARVAPCSCRSEHDGKCQQLLGNFLIRRRVQQRHFAGYVWVLYLWVTFANWYQQVQNFHYTFFGMTHWRRTFDPRLDCAPAQWFKLSVNNSAFNCCN